MAIMEPKTVRLALHVFTCALLFHQGLQCVPKSQSVIKNVTSANVTGISLPLVSDKGITAHNGDTEQLQSQIHRPPGFHSNAFKKLQIQTTHQLSVSAGKKTDKSALRGRQPWLIKTLLYESRGQGLVGIPRKSPKTIGRFKRSENAEDKLNSVKASHTDSPISFHSPHLCPCQIQTTSQDLTVQCSRLSLKTSDLNPSCFPFNTTVVLLDENAMETIPPSLFSHLHTLRKLSIPDNVIKNIDATAFYGLSNLEILNLEGNQLTISPDLHDVFAPLVNLKQLLIAYNEYCKQDFKQILKFISSLKTLEHLSIDSCGLELYFGHRFTDFKSLSNLEITGDVLSVVNNSFENVRHLTNLTLQGLENLSNFSDQALRPLRKLKVLVLEGIFIGLKDALQILEPVSIQSNNMTEINFTSVSLAPYEVYTDLYHNNVILDANSTKHLRKICVKKVALTVCHIMVIKSDSLHSKTWERCLQYLDLSDNPLLGTLMGFVQIGHNMKHLETLVVQYAVYAYGHHHEAQKDVTASMKSVDAVTHKKNDNGVHDFTTHWFNSTNDKVSRPISFNEGNILNMETMLSPHTEATSNVNCLIVYLSPSVKTLKFNRLIQSSSVDMNVCLQAENLKFADFSSCGLHAFTGNFSGPTRIQKIILSFNDVSVLSPTWFDHFPSLLELELSHCKLDANFFTYQSARVFQKLVALKHLDISSNSLYLLDRETFSTNQNLVELNLAGNMFKNIPFDLRNTPNLRQLDMRGNAITQLSLEVTSDLDTLAKKSRGLHLLLEGNLLSCGCDNIPFLFWLQNTHVTFDLAGNFTCISDDVKLSNTAIHGDLEAMWRKCNGSFYLVLSVSLFSITVLTFISFFFVMRHKTFLISAMRKLFKEPKCPKDYPLGVFISYAHADHQFPCFVLNPFIETRLGLKTFVIARDSRVGSDIAWNIVEAISSSWRILLVVTEASISTDDWFLFTCKSTLYSQTVENPDRVVVLVERAMQGFLPADLLASVYEDNIIVIERWEMTYHLREQLRTRLL